MKVEIWSDVVCPWCHVGKRRLEEALSRFPHRDEVEVEWKSFELDPGAQAASHDESPDHATRLARKYGTTPAAAQQMIDRITATGAEVGLDIHFERAVQANTFAAHQVIHLGAAHGVQHAVKERLLLAYFTQGEDLNDTDTLARLGAEAGLDPDEVRAALADQRYSAAVRSDGAEARMLGISGVPFFVVDRTYGVSGAQPPEHLLAMLEQAWAAGHPLTMVGTTATADACGPEGCRV